MLSSIYRVAHESLGGIEMNYQDALRRLDALRLSHDLDAVEQLIAEVEPAPNRGSPEEYFQFLLTVCDMLSSYDFGDYQQQTQLMHRYADQALAEVANVPLDLELPMLVHLEEDLPTTEA